ncbi:DUF3017 domain-containing protein [Nocardioides jiangxiensis]|uniref:DUF3017 domain-containing protein n=1 Tax=Nocardioides jiangxiensis TaxID=3064524 RepID=A0ABT9AYJ2_9ACTN|nr:DUF3017 domain-containing protein [Nocardioides sp. WY-20]MDO7867564.1 DUF3017 domain-containing protein [Nocardioides sp. WY-20]
MVDEPAEPVDATEPLLPEDADLPGDMVPGVDAVRGPLPPLREVARLKQPSTIGGVIYLVVLGLALVGIAIGAAGAWRLGVTWLGGALLVATGGRLVLPGDDAGMLGVRRRRFDTLLLAGVGVVLIILAATIPDQP